MSIKNYLIYLPALLIEMSASSAIPRVIFRASELGASSLFIGIMASVNIFLYVLFCQVFGRLSNRIGRKKLTRLACISFSVLYFTLSFCKDLRQLGLLFPINGIILSAFWPALEAWIGEHNNGKTLMERVKIFNLSWTTGAIIGFLTGGYIAEIYSFAPFYFASFFGLVAMMAITIQPEPKSQPKDENTNEEYINNQSLIMKYLYLSWIANFISGLTNGVLRFIFPKLINQIGMTQRIYGLLSVCQIGMQAIMFFIFGSTERWHYKLKYLVGFQILACLGFISIWLIDTPRLWIPGLMIIGVNVGMTYFSSIYYSLNGHLDIGSKAGLHESIISGGALMGPAVGGVLANFVGLKYPYLFCAVMVIVGVCVQIVFSRIRLHKVAKVG